MALAGLQYGCLNPTVGPHVTGKSATHSKKLFAALAQAKRQIARQ
jgi:hypothetical protein